MYLKTVKPHISVDKNDDIAALISYIENLKEEISFRIDALNKRIDLIQTNNVTPGGDSI